nr:divergent polysaccharide deacetylase family protein [Kordiimonas marina]
MKRQPEGWSWARFARYAKLFYGGIVTLVLIGLIYVLEATPPVDETRPEAVAAQAAAVEHDPEVAAILTDMGQKKATPVRNIPKVVRQKPEKPAWLEYAAHWDRSAAPKVAIVVDDLGLSEEATHELAKMRGPYTLSFLPYAENLPTQTRLVHKAGHELMVHMPMQPHGDTADPGTNALINGLSAQEFERRVMWNLSRFHGFVGINNHMGSLLTEEPAPMVRVMVHLRQQGLLFLDSLTSPHSVALRAAEAAGVPGIARDIFLDNVREPELIMAQLKKTEHIARLRGWAVAIGHPYPETLETLAKWRKTLERKHIVLVPLSQLVARRNHIDLQTASLPSTTAR